MSQSVISALCVSILVFVELALGDRDSEQTAYVSYHVSILVFVELALGVDAESSHTVRAYEFQSLFLWNSPSE